MGFRWVTELFDGRQGGIRDGLQRRYTRRFQVMTDDKRVGPKEVIFAPGIPLLYSSYVSFDANEIDFFGICRDVDAIQDPDDWQLWHVTCEYDTQSSSEFGGNAGQPGSIGQPGAGGGSGASGDPSQEPPTIDWGFEIRDVAFTKDLSGLGAIAGANLVQAPAAIVMEGLFGRAVLNSARQPFDPPPTREWGFPTLTYSRNELTYDPIHAADFSLAMNSEEFMGRPKFTVLSRPITSSQKHIGAYKYYRVRYELWFLLETNKDWMAEFLDAGFNELIDGVHRRITDKRGHPVAEVSLLKDGLKLTEAQLANPAIGPQFLRFQQYKAKDLNLLDIVL